MFTVSFIVPHLDDKFETVPETVRALLGLSVTLSALSVILPASRKSSWIINIRRYVGFPQHPSASLAQTDNTMLNLAVPITPPKPGSQAAQMSPAQFLVSSPTRASVKRKASLPKVTEMQAKRFCLEPLPNSDDTTMPVLEEGPEGKSFLVLSPV
jgi:hypothetical protein